ncbi:MAG TPA: sensor histidine kinase [Solirubrobacteraceae bacterium]|nr:sensor histidine kinase [Solirubrobacteraceae bacterium]
MTDCTATDLVNEPFAFWNRRARLAIRLLSYGLLALVTIADVAIRGGFTAHARADVVLAAASAAWMVPLSLWSGTAGPVRRAVFFVGLIALTAALVIRSPIYGFWGFTGYFWVGQIMYGRARYVGLVAVAACEALSQTGGAPKLDAGALTLYLAALAINAGVSFAISRSWWAGEMQSERRRQAIDRLTETNRRLAETLAENRALQQQLVTQAREAGISEERQRMAREIHDTLAQGLTGIITQLQAAVQATGGRAHERHIDAAIDLARESLSEARRSVNALAPSVLTHARLPEAIGHVAARWSELHGIAAAVTTTGEPCTIAPELEVALLRTAQEALANVAKHARATRVGLTLSYMEDQVTLDVRDDGIGFLTPPAPVREDGGFGLAAMRQRLDGVSGHLEIESEPDGGTAVSATVPVFVASGAP